MSSSPCDRCHAEGRTIPAYWGGRYCPACCEVAARWFAQKEWPADPWIPPPPATPREAELRLRWALRLLDDAFGELNAA